MTAHQTVPSSQMMAIYRVPIAGGEPTVVTTIALGQCVKCWASYFTDAVEDGNGSIRRVPVTGGPVTILAAHQDSPYTIAVDDACVYWNALHTDSTTTSSTLRV